MASYFSNYPLRFWMTWWGIISQTPGWMRKKRGLLLYPLLCNNEVRGSPLTEPPSSADNSVLHPNQNGVSQLGRTWDTPLPISIHSLVSECISHLGQEGTLGKVTAHQNQNPFASFWFLPWNLVLRFIFLFSWEKNALSPPHCLPQFWRLLRSEAW